jgi:gas vesicle protein
MTDRWKPTVVTGEGLSLSNEEEEKLIALTELFPTLTLKNMARIFDELEQEKKDSGEIPANVSDMSDERFKKKHLNVDTKYIESLIKEWQEVIYPDDAKLKARIRHIVLRVNNGEQLTKGMSWVGILDDLLLVFDSDKKIRKILEEFKSDEKLKKATEVTISMLKRGLE